MEKKILVVEDDIFVLTALDNFLIHENFHTRTVAKAQEVTSAVEEFKPDLIVMDICLDTADGRTICDKLKAETGTAHIPIVLLTGLSYEAISRIDCQADAIIGKPFENGSLLSTISKCLEMA